jgi:hypothetical protein
MCTYFHKLLDGCFILNILKLKKVQSADNGFSRVQAHHPDTDVVSAGCSVSKLIAVRHRMRTLEIPLDTQVARIVGVES